MQRTSLIRLGGSVAVVGGVAYANLGVVVWYLQPSSNSLGIQYLFSVSFILLVVGALAAIASLHILHRGESNAMTEALVSLVAFVGVALILIGELGDILRLVLRDTDALWYFTPLFWGMALAAFGIMALAMVSFVARVLPWWCGVALVIGSPSFALVGIFWEAWLGALVGMTWALVGFAIFRAGTRQAEQPSRVR